MIAFLSKFIVFLSLLFSAGFESAAQCSDKSISPEILPNIKIEPSIADTVDSRGVVHGHRQCGGPGKLVEWRIDQCEAARNSRCRINQTTLHSEVDFIPSESMQQLGLRIVYLFPGERPKTVFEKPIENSSVQAGEQHTLMSAAKVSKELKGKTFTVQYFIYRVANDMAEVCTEAVVELV